MPSEPRFCTFLVAWSVVALLNAALNGYAGDLPSLPYRGTALGMLLLLASGAHGLERIAARNETAYACGRRIQALVYAALFTALAVPSVAWRCLAPLDTTGIAGLHHGASIIFVFGVLSLAMPRVLTTRGISLESQPLGELW